MLAPAGVADTIYTGGDIITINDAMPSAEARAVKGWQDHSGWRQG